MKFFFAPLQGYTDAAYRIFHNEMYQGCIDCYYTPFIRVEHGEVRKKDLKEIESLNSSAKTVPQIIVKNVDEFKILTQTIIEKGCKEIDINMGCPFPLQTNRGRGAGILSNPKEVATLLREVSKMQDVEFSLKMRLGHKDNKEWTCLVDDINSTKLKHITIHPRIATQQYKGSVDIDEFRQFCDKIKHKIVYNGDITAITQIDSLRSLFPELYGIMIGLIIKNT